MTNKTKNTTLAQLALSDFNLVEPDKPLSEQELLDYLAEAIAYMMEHKMDFLMSLLYRLDIAEDKIAIAFLPGNSEPANIALARTVLDRQKLRVATKQAYREQSPSNWDWDLD